MKTSVKTNLNKLDDQKNEHSQKFVVTLLLTIEQNIVLNLNLKILDIDDLNHEDASIFTILIISKIIVIGLIHQIKS